MAFSDKQKLVLKFPYLGYDALICDGAVRSGKTSVMSLSFLLWAMANFNLQNFAFCGKSVGSVERNILKPLLNVLYLQKEFSLSYNRGDHALSVKRGNKSNTFYLFGGKDESSFALIQGITLAGVLLDEVALVPRSFAEQAVARCSVDGSLLWFNCNPDSPDHWFYKEWILCPERHNALLLHFRMEDNPSLSPATIRRYHSAYSGLFYQRFVLGQWVAVDGLVYPMFDPALHVVDNVPPAALHQGAWFVSVDYGTVNPCSMGLWLLFQDTAYRVNEYFYDSRAPGNAQKTDEEHYQALVRLVGSRQVQRVVVDPSAASFKETIRRHGRFPVWDADNSVLDGIRVTATLLKAGKIKFLPGCKDCISEFGLYRWDPDAQRDAVLKEFDHAMDDVRYFCNSVLIRYVNQFEVLL